VSAGHVHRLEIVFTCGETTVRKHAEGTDEQLLVHLLEMAEALGWSRWDQ
jgi:hypothetical protein